MNRQTRIHAPGDVRIDHLDDLPAVPPRGALIDVDACGICGSDLGYIAMGGVPGSPTPMDLGHEVSGTVRTVGAAVTDFHIGDPVVVFPGNDAIGRVGNGGEGGGLADTLVVTDAAVQLYHLPASIPTSIGFLAEPVAVGMHAVAQADTAPGDRAVVFGCGPVGLAAVATLHDLGATDVVGVDPSSTRRRLARRLGARHTIDPTTADVWSQIGRFHGHVDAMFGTAPATSVYIEATGVGRVLGDVIDHAGPRSRISVVGVHHTRVPTNFTAVLMNELTIRGSIEYPPRFEDAIELLARHDLSRMITHRFELDDLDRALELLTDSKECGKVAIVPRRD